MSLDKVSPGVSIRGYSAKITITLTIAGEHFNVASVGPKHIVVRNAHRVEACRGILRLKIDERLSEQAIELPNGIDPDIDRQPYTRLGEATGEIAA